MQACTLRDVFEQNQMERCDILKMDVEGAEFGILYGAGDDLLKRIAAIYVECHPCGSRDPRWNLKSMAAFLKAKGFGRQEVVGKVSFALGANNHDDGDVRYIKCANFGIAAATASRSPNQEAIETQALAQA